MMWTILLVFLVPVLSQDFLENVIEEKEMLLQKELDMMLGNDIVLSDSELKANEIIMNLKLNELDYAFKHPQYYNLSKHFFEYKDSVKKTKLYEILQQMPKGAILHAHDTGILNSDYVVSLTYAKDLYVCFEESDIQFKFSKDPPEDTCETEWQLLSDVRYSSDSVENFDAELRKHFTIVVEKPNEVYTDINKIWNKFQQVFITTSSIFCYKPVWEQYFYDTLKAFREENIMYVEIRSVLPPLYDLEGNIYDSVATAESTKRVVDEFIAEYPDFYGAKLIYAPLRLVDKKTVEEYIKIAKQIKRRLPDFLAGFDLVGQEDLGAPTKEFLPILAEAANELDYFFHAGETNWNGMSSDENLIDSIALGTRRLGHAFAIAKHPALIEVVKERDIGIEVNVISNAVLKLVEDVRNHPLALFLAQGLPVVLSSDDPGLWEADPITHDFYVAFVGVASRHADLKMLKKLAINSLKYSTVSNKEKVIKDFQIRWAKFIDTIVNVKYEL